MTATRERAVGCLLGLACGDALGRPVGGESSAAVARRHGRVTEMRGDGARSRPAGSVTDDAALALRTARSLVDCGGFDGADLAGRVRDWVEGGPRAVDATTAAAVDHLSDGVSWKAAGEAVRDRRSAAQRASNGSLARCVPFALTHRSEPERLAAVTDAATAITHADPRCRAAGVALARLLAALLDGATGAAARQASLDLAAARDAPPAVRETLAVATETDLATLDTAGVVGTLETALHDGLTADSAADAVETAVNRGGDADTVGAVTGAVAGARLGADALPDRWFEPVDVTDEFRSLAPELLALDATSPDC
ncbi:MAG: ADP-ribosylglycohydrolase family protein [Halobacteriaceae archaeon]